MVKERICCSRVLHSSGSGVSAAPEVTAAAGARATAVALCERCPMTGGGGLAPEDLWFPLLQVRQPVRLCMQDQNI